MIKRKPSQSHVTTLALSSARRLIAQHGVNAGEFANARLQASLDAGDPAETEIWSAIVAAIPNIFSNQRV